MRVHIQPPSPFSPTSFSPRSEFLPARPTLHPYSPHSLRLNFDSDLHRSISRSTNPWISAIPPLSDTSSPYVIRETEPGTPSSLSSTQQPRPHTERRCLPVRCPLLSLSRLATLPRCDITPPTAPCERFTAPTCIIILFHLLAMSVTTTTLQLPPLPPTRLHQRRPMITTGHDHSMRLQLATHQSDILDRIPIAVREGQPAGTLLQAIRLQATTFRSQTITRPQSQTRNL